MGNANQSGITSNDAAPSNSKSVPPIAFHDVHSDNIQLSSDRRRARRIETFCKGICFSSRPILPNEHVFLRFAEISTSWSGAIRFGFTSHDPATIQHETLPRYACPDLTNKPGFWAKALPERLARSGIILSFHFTPAGDVMFGINGEEKGAFFSGVVGKMALWGLIDVYGNTTAVEFVDGYQLNNSTAVDNVRPLSSVSVDNAAVLGMFSRLSFSDVGPSSSVILGPQSTPVPVRHIADSMLRPLAFYPGVVGRNICLSPDGTIAVRRVEDYCNAYVFAPRPFVARETIVVQVLAVDTAYTGGLAFGMTCCSPAALRTEVLPDDSDLLLDRPEYWVVNKDVCATAQVGDELTFHLTDDGAIHYGRNGHHVATLMHVDKTLPMWAFFDVYGSTQKIKLLGVIDGPPPWERASRGGSDIPDVVQNHAGGSAIDHSMTPPPRPPPHRSSPSASSSRALPTPPLPQKQHRQFDSLPASSREQAASRSQFIVTATSFPAPPSQPVATVPHRSLSASMSASTLPAPRLRNPRRVHEPRPVPLPAEILAGKSSETADNASNECSICLERASDCVLYTCGHMCLCYECAMNVRRAPDPACPICRQPIRDVIKIFRT